MPPLSPPSADDLEIAAEYTVAKIGMHTIAKRRGLTLSKVRCALKRAGVTELRARVLAYDLRRIREFPGHDAIRSAYARTGSVNGACRELGLTYQTVIGSLRASGVPINPPGGRWKLPPTARAEIVAFAHRRGLREAAKRWGLNRSTVYWYRKAARHAALGPAPVATPHPCDGCNFPTTDGRLCYRCQIAA